VNGRGGNFTVERFFVATGTVDVLLSVQLLNELCVRITSAEKKYAGNRSDGRVSTPSVEIARSKRPPSDRV